MDSINFKEQAETYLTGISARKGNPLRPNTLLVYRYLLNTRILPVIGEVRLADVNNKTAKMLVGRLTEAQLSPATITLAVSLVKQVVKSAVDDEGNQLHPRTWNTQFIDAPRVEPTSQKAPITPDAAISAAVARTSGEIRALIALLSGTGLRIGEALALQVGADNGRDSYWDPQAGMLTIRSTFHHGETQYATKTKAGTRVVDLSPGLNAALIGALPGVEGPMFRTSSRTLRRRLSAAGITTGFHGMRRFRITQMQSNNVPAALIKFWAGHAAGDITERYTKFGSQIEERKGWSQKAGLGFEL
jgi:integrase